ncbi:MAG: peptide-methionine (S)-S-oxide reductase MsrA [Mariprofundaceae bacterium]|nr:peptide-methionine (S)-S-oxide reductase MsrA [Mariprofundaceae bacterium]
MPVFKRLMMLLIAVLVPWSAMAVEPITAKDMMKPGGNEVAIFAGGCFWCMEKPFEQVPGVSAVISGYSGGKSTNPTYRNYARGGHIEVVKVIFDPEQVSYDKLLDVFWRQIDPTDSGGQFVDRGHEYTSAIFYLNESQHKTAIASKKRMDESAVFGAPIITPVRPASPFYAAEEYHQDYYRKSSLRYWYYRSRSGRDDYLERIWGREAMKEQP